MARRSSSGTEGLSITDQWLDPDGKLKPKGHPDRKRRRFRARVLIPGSTSYKVETFDDRAEAKLWGQRRLADYRSGLDTPDDADLGKIADEYIKGLRTVTTDEPGISEGYARHMELVAAGLVKAGIKDMKDPSFPARAREWIAGLKPGWHSKLLMDVKSPAAHRQTPLTNTTRNRIVRELRTLGSYTVKTRRMLYNPCLAVDSFPTAKHLRPQFELSELRTLVSEKSRYVWGQQRRDLEDLLESCGGDKQAVAKRLKVNIATVYNRLKADPNESDPWWLPTVLMVYGGFRVAEAMHLRWQDINWQGKRIRVRLQEAYDQKTDTEREVPLAPELEVILGPMAKTTGYIIESQSMRESGSAIRDSERKIVRHEYAHGFKRYLDRIGIPRDRGEGDRVPHSLRHAWVAMMIASGESSSLAADWAGHSGDVQKIYRSQADAYHRDGARLWERGQITLRAS